MGNDARAAGTYTRDPEGDVPRHFFFDKMEKVELEPLKPEQMVEAYRKRFKKAIEPFTEDALFTLARTKGAGLSRATGVEASPPL
jgi:hypothetical protein